MVEGVIFDLDGTLLNSMDVWDNVGAVYLVSKGVKPPKELNETLKIMSMLESAEYFKKKYGISDTTDEIINDVNQIVEDYYMNEAALKDYVSEMLETFQKLNIKMWVATAIDRKIAAGALRNNGIDKYISGITTCVEVGQGKSSPLVYQTACKDMGIDIDQVIVVEDALHAIITAKKAGFKVVAIKDKHSENDRDAIVKIADRYINTFSEWEIEKEYK